MSGQRAHRRNCAEGPGLGLGRQAEGPTGHRLAVAVGGVGVPEQCGGSLGPRQCTQSSWFGPIVLPLDTCCLVPFPQNLPVETLGPESSMDPEPSRAPQAPQGPCKADGEEVAGTSDGEGSS